MPKLYCRVNPRTNIEKRDRAGQRFSRDWKELDGIDDATLAALQEDPYLEVSETPTVLVEVAAVTQAGAIATAQDPNNTPESEATNEGSTGEIAAEGTDTGTASPVANVESVNAEVNHAETTGDMADPVADAVQQEPADVAAEASVSTAEAQVGSDQRMDAIKAAIAQLDANNAEQWLKDGRPNLDAVVALTGFNVLAAERDQAWTQIKNQAAAE